MRCESAVSSCMRALSFASFSMLRSAWRRTTQSMGHGVEVVVAVAAKAEEENHHEERSAVDAGTRPLELASA